MRKLRFLEKVVEKYLIKDEIARNSDRYLYSLICKDICKEHGKNFEEITLAEWLIDQDRNGFLPNFESVGRARRKLQEKHPELAPSDSAKIKKFLLEEEFRDYALSS